MQTLWVATILAWKEKVCRLQRASEAQLFYWLPDRGTGHCAKSSQSKPTVHSDFPLISIILALRMFSFCFDVAGMWFSKCIQKRRPREGLKSCLDGYATRFYGFLLCISQRLVFKSFPFLVESFIHDSVNKTTHALHVWALVWLCILLVSGQLCWTQFSLYFKFGPWQRMWSWLCVNECWR